MKLKHLLGLLVFCLATGIYWAQEQPQGEAESAQKSEQTQTGATPTEPEPVHGFKLTPEDAARKNPRKFTTVSVERGKKIYDTQCAMCHGMKGDGKGEAVAEMKLNPPNFTSPGLLDKRADGEIHAIISGGSTLMPGQGTRMTDTHKWNLVNYLRALSGKDPVRSTGDEPEEGVILIPQ